MTDYKRVYQGGHHDVWCNGSEHLKTMGGYVHPDQTSPGKPLRAGSKPYKCDCQEWRDGSALRRLLRMVDM